MIIGINICELIMTKVIYNQIQTRALSQTGTYGDYRNL